ncbi:MAG: 6,7-dimethyl-8-ribityllumazine synthase [Bacteroidales bacterium]|nr:6,7-dimethyl-8-ribityllumazine synthase [Bacteroidales bacterium]
MPKKKDLSAYDPHDIPDAAGKRFGIVVADWNREVTDALLDGAADALHKHGVHKEDVVIYRVPGSFELPQGAFRLIEKESPDAVLCLGCVIQGETRHFEFIAQAVANGCMKLSLESGIPVIFGVLTTDTYDQALQRSGGKHGNKGVEAALTAIKMACL